jgi:hypothetical protein
MRMTRRSLTQNSSSPTFVSSSCESGSDPPLAGGFHPGDARDARNEADDSRHRDLKRRRTTRSCPRGSACRSARACTSSPCAPPWRNHHDSGGSPSRAAFHHYPPGGYDHTSGDDDAPGSYDNRSGSNHDDRAAQEKHPSLDHDEHLDHSGQHLDRSDDGSTSCVPLSCDHGISPW